MAGASPTPGPPHARLEVICGPMFSGKSTLLVQRLRAAIAALEPTAPTHQLVRAIKPARDTRYAHTELATHRGEKFPATPIHTAEQLIAATTGAAVVGIDEAHFFAAGLVAPVAQLLCRGVRIIVAGLERDHLGRPFEPFPTLLCEADEVIKLTGPCAVCGKPAIHSQRLVAGSERIVVGGAGDYEPRCRSCFNPSRE